MKYKYSILVLAFLAALWPASNSFSQDHKILGHQAFVIKNINIIPMTSKNDVIENAT